MPTTREQKKARKSRGAEMFSDIENFDIMLGEINPDREESELSNSVRRPENTRYNALVNHGVKSLSNSTEDDIRGYARNGRNSGEVDSSSEIKWLSGELNQRITKEMSDIKSSVSSQIQTRL